MNNTAVLEELMKLSKYQEQRKHIFSSNQSLRWYLRQHRTGLEGASALLYIAGRIWINPQRFDNYVLDAGAEDFRRRREAA